MLNDDEVDVYLCIFLAFHLCFCLRCSMHFILSSWRLKSCYKGQDASNSVFPPFEIRLGELEGISRKGAVELSRRVVFLYPGICSKMREAGERSSIGAKCGIFDFPDPPAEGRRRKVGIKIKDKAESGFFDF